MGRELPVPIKREGVGSCHLLLTQCWARSCHWEVRQKIRKVISGPKKQNCSVRFKISLHDKWIFDFFLRRKGAHTEVYKCIAQYPRYAHASLGWLLQLFNLWKWCIIETPISDTNSTFSATKLMIIYILCFEIYRWICCFAALKRKTSHEIGKV